MTLRLVRTAGAVAASAALIALGALPAAATTPGEGAVIFNPDGTPIGSELLYGAVPTPQWVYTSETSDDDYWGLDSSSPAEPANYAGSFNSVDTGVPLGFEINVSGVVYDEVLINSNGGVCFLSSTDFQAQESFDVCSGMYYRALGVYADPAYNTPDTTDFAGILPLGNDFYSPYATPVDTEVDPDADPDACTFGAYFDEFDGGYYCSSVFWGATTYEGKNAFAATWYHDPDIHVEDEDVSEFSTFQVIIVDEGDGNVTVVNNYDDLNQLGQDLGASGILEDCDASYDAGDNALYDFAGIFGTDFAGSPSKLTLFGPACDSPIFTADAAALRNGGSFAAIEHSLDSDVAGRYIYRVVDGEPEYTPAAAQLASTGTNASVPLFIGLSVLLVGGALLMYRRIHSTN